MLTFDEFRRALNFSQPKLELRQTDGLFVAEGAYCVTDGPNASGPIEEFEIQLAVDPRYPKTEPALREVAERIPQDIDRHMFGNGFCCTCVWEEWLVTAEDTSFEGFCAGPLRNFFLSQLYFESKGKWPFGERKHGLEGLVEAVSRILGFKVSQAQAIQHLNAVISPNPKGHWTCVCGSGLRIRDCDPQHLPDLRTRLGHENIKRLKERLRVSMREERRALAQAS